MRKSSVTQFGEVQVGVFSFGREGIYQRPKAQFEFDVSNFRDPAGQKQFEGRTGFDPQVRDWVGDDRRIKAILETIQLIVEDLRAPVETGTAENPKIEPRSKWISISFSDVQGRWISPAVAELVANYLSDKCGYDVLVRHYGLNYLAEKNQVKYGGV